MHEVCVHDITYWEYYGCLTRCKTKSKYPIRKDVGHIKSMPSDIPGIKCG